jgi:hypothetical protein
MTWSLLNMDHSAVLELGVADTNTFEFYLLLKHQCDVFAGDELAISSKRRKYGFTKQIGKLIFSFSFSFSFLMLMLNLRDIYDMI